MDTNRADRDTTYDHDYFGWTQQQAAYLRSGRTDHYDIKNLAEEIESLGKAQLHALTSSYRLIAMHLLKFIVQPDRSSVSWAATITRERGNIELMLDDSPGMRPKREERFAKAYPITCRDAAAETGVPLEQFPSEPPFNVDELECRTFWPAAAKAVLQADHARR